MADGTTISRKEMAKAFSRFLDDTKALDDWCERSGWKWIKWTKREKDQIGFNVTKDQLEVSFFWPEPGKDSDIGFNTKEGKKKLVGPSWQTKLGAKISKKKYNIIESRYRLILAPKINQAAYRIHVDDIGSIKSLAEIAKLSETLAQVRTLRLTPMAQS